MKNEIESKALLARYGLRTTRPRLVETAGEAAEAGAAINAPLAMKIVSPDIVHKVAAGGVALDVAPENAASCFEEILTSVRTGRPQARIDGVLIEEMAPKGEELFIGARLDPDYGPVVLFGPGGTGVEKGRKPAACLAPLSGDSADRLIAEVMIEAPTDTLREVLRTYLLAIGGPDGLLIRERVGEIDVNPVILSGDTAVAVDAVVRPLPEGEATLDMPVSDSEIDDRLSARRGRLAGLDALFEPESVAIVGASNTKGKLGYRMVQLMLDAGYKGRIFPIHPKADEICGLKAYPSVSAVPSPVERAFVVVGAAQVPEVIADCAEAGVKVAQVLTAGFSEYTGDAGTRLEGEIKRVLAGSDLRMVGPNCIGTFSASGRLGIGPPRYAPGGTGGITFVSQSGTFACDVVRRAQVQGLPVGRVLSAGNCSDLDMVDYLLFCEDDPGTSVSAFYAESLRDPGLFFRLAQQARKPVILMKGGTTEQGITAASSHTAALATDQVLWNAAVQESGVLQVSNIEELMDALLIHSAHDTLRGARLGVFGSGGGVSVTMSDAAARLGLTLPSLAPSTAKALGRFGVPGTSVANPIDIPVWGLRDGDRYIFDEVIDLLKVDANVDSIIVYVEVGSIMDFAENEADGQRQLEEICASVERARADGPRVSLALRSSGDRLQDDLVRSQRLNLLKKGIAVFPSAARAVRAHAMLAAMSRRVEGRHSQLEVVAVDGPAPSIAVGGST